jgi:hypothetical protein
MMSVEQMVERELAGQNEALRKTSPLPQVHHKYHMA